MKRICPFLFVSFAALVLLFFSNLSYGQTALKNHIKISAHFTGLKDGYYYLNSSGNVGIDSCKAQNGNLTFKYFGETDGLLISSTKDIANDGTVFMTPIFLVDKSDIMLKGDAGDIMAMEVVESAINKKSQRIKELLLPLNEKRNDFVVGNQPAKADSIEKLITSIYKDEVNHNLNSTYGMMMLYYTALSKSVSPPEVQQLLNQFNNKINDSRWTLAVKSWIKNSTSIGIGAMAPDFVQPNANGKKVSLSDYRGKYVLLEFWSSWCGPCRDENPRLVKIYNKFAKYGFEIVAVSTDLNKQAWLDAIKNDKLTWLQLSDLKGQSNDAAALYNISSIPSSFLINPKGQIIAVKLRGDMLAEKLSEIFEKK